MYHIYFNSIFSLLWENRYKTGLCILTFIPKYFNTSSYWLYYFWIFCLCYAVWRTKSSLSEYACHFFLFSDPTVWSSCEVWSWGSLPCFSSQQGIPSVSQWRGLCAVVCITKFSSVSSLLSFCWAIIVCYAFLLRRPYKVNPSFW